MIFSLVFPNNFKFIEIILAIENLVLHSEMRVLSNVFGKIFAHGLMLEKQLFASVAD